MNPSENLAASRTAHLLAHVMHAHGGQAAWRAQGSVSVDVASGGLAFSSKGQGRALQAVRAIVQLHEARVTLRDYGGPGHLGAWQPDRVTWSAPDGRVLAERIAPRERLLQGGWWWDRLDALYFAGYALWNYLRFPWLLRDEGVRVTAEPAISRRFAFTLRADFPPGYPTHSAVQRFHFDADGRLLRHDYTADVISRFATAAHRCLAESTVDGLRVYTRRRVVPKLFGLPLPGPTLVAIALDDVRWAAGRTGAADATDARQSSP